MDEETLIILFIATVAFLIFICVFLALWSVKKRREALRAIASNMVFSFEPKPSPSPHLDYPRFKLFQIGHSRRGLNLMKGNYLGIHFVIFDYHYTVGGGKHSQHYSQTVAIAHIDDLDLPYFTMGPESFFSKAGKIFGFNDINFDTNEKFSENYKLKGHDEIRIRELFNMQVLYFFEGKSSKINIEAVNDQIMVFKPSKKIKTGDISEHLYEVSTIVNIISNAGY